MIGKIMKAVISIDGKQEVVTKGDTLAINGKTEKKTMEFPVLMTIDDDKVNTGTPIVEGASVKAKVIGEKRSDKVTSIRYKAKKRVHKTRGNRQDQTIIEITSVS